MGISLVENIKHCSTYSSSLLSSKMMLSPVVIRYFWHDYNIGVIVNMKYGSVYVLDN